MACAGPVLASFHQQMTCQIVMVNRGGKRCCAIPQDFLYPLMLGIVEVGGFFHPIEAELAVMSVGIPCIDVPQAVGSGVACRIQCNSNSFARCHPVTADRVGVRVTAVAEAVAVGNGVILLATYCQRQYTKKPYLRSIEV